MSRSSKGKNQPESIDNHGGHLPDYETMGKGCAYCVMEGKKKNIRHLFGLQHSIILIKGIKNFSKSIIFMSTYNIHFINSVVFCLVFIYFHSLFEFLIYINFFIYLVIFSIL